MRGCLRVRSPGNRLALIDVVSDEGPLLVTDRVTDRSYTGRKYRLRVRAQVAADASRLPETVDVNVHAESFQHGSSLGRATLTTPDGVHEVRVGQRMLALLVDDPVDPGHLRVFTVVPVDSSRNVLQVDAYGVLRGGDANAALERARTVLLSAVVAPGAGGAR